MNYFKYYKPLLLAACCLLLSLFGYAQNIVINGRTLVYPNETVTYTLHFQHYLGQRPVFNWQVEGGIIERTEEDPAGSISVTVRWADVFSYRTPFISVTESETLQRGQQQVQGYDPTKNDCQAFPLEQYTNKSQQPCIISGVAYCMIDRSTGQPYPHRYQWQWSDEQQLMWEDIPGATEADYQPPALADYTPRAYRRITTYTVEGKDESITSNACLVYPRSLDAGYLEVSGTREGQAIAVSYGTRPDMTAWSAAGGKCEIYQYQYTWERSDNNGPWYEIGTGKTYPANAPGINRRNVRLRRIVRCNGSEATTNILTYTFPFDYPNKENLNYVRTNNIFVRGIQYWEEADMLPTGEKLQQTTYLDGLGRPVQEVTKDFATNGDTLRDLVGFTQYDNLGRTPRQYLPYPSTENPGKFKTNTTNDQQQYYQNTFGESPAYSRVEYDGSPLHIAEKGFAPGIAWGGSNQSSKGTFKLNTADEDVKRWTIGFLATDIPALRGAYAPGELAKSESTDERGRRVISYTNRSGQTVLVKTQLADNPSAAHDGWVCVYSIYDELNRLRWRIQPEGVKQLQANGWNISNTIKEEQCFRYWYDQRGRMTVSKAPGQGELWMVYDNRDRLVLTQNSNQRASGQWSFSLYDALDRAVSEGTVNLSMSRTEAQSYVNALAPGNRNLTINTGTPETVTVNSPVVGGSWCSTCSSVQYNSLSYYDTYGYAGVKSFSLDFEFEQSASGINQIEPPVKSARLNGLPTGGKTRVQGGGGVWLTSTVYYDNDGQPLQTLSSNIRGGTDITTVQYDFAGRSLASSSRHSNPAAGYNNFPINRKTDFDKLGRTTAVYEALGFGGVFKKIATYQYNDLGRLEQKKLGTASPNPSAGGALETLKYSYNLHGWITGINKDYAASPNPSEGGGQWARYFGYLIDYENKTGLFTTAQLDGKITGWQWRSQGDGVQRRYNFEYDNYNRLTAARFTQNEAGSWGNAKMDFSSYMSYDLNGNLQTLSHRGVVPGRSPLLVDSLHYRYKPGSNQLLEVSDALSALGNQNGKLGDFKDGPLPASPAGGGAGDDYAYDAEGNMLSDKNKGISSVQYNHQNLPVKITVTGKGEIEYIYDADGSKLQKIVRETGKPEKLTTYIGGFVYEKIGTNPEALQYTMHPEGRVRVITPVGNVNQPNYIGGGVGLPGGKQGVYDYYITDHLGNVRMILTEEQHRAGDMCTMEETDAQIKAREEGQFGNPGAGNEVVSSRVSTPAAWRAILPAGNTIKEKVSKLQASGQKTGPNVLLKVMAGDLLHLKADYFYEGNSFSGSGTPVATLVNGLLTALMNDKGSQLGKAFRTDVSTQLNATQPLTDLLSPQSSGGASSVPHGYINYIFFDEQFNYAGGDFVRVNSSGNGTAPIARTNIRVPKNGWVYAYLSNESNEAVYFDNFAVTHERGRILEESHYYPYGLKIAAISSRAEGKAENKYLYNGKELASGEFEDGSGLDWYEYGMREYDAQIGRFFRVDPLTDEYPYLTPYQYASCEPIANIDIDGLEAGNATGARPYNYTNVSGSGTFETAKDYGLSYFDTEIGEQYYRLASRSTPNVTAGNLYFPTYGEINAQLNLGAIAGAAEAAWEMVKGAAILSNPAANPLEIARMEQGLKERATKAIMMNPRQPLETMGVMMIADYGKEKYDMITSGDPFTAGKAVGGVAFDVGSLVLGPGGVGSQVGKVGRLMRGSTQLKLGYGVGEGTKHMILVRPIARSEKVASLIDELKTLTFQTGNEHAIVKLAGNQRVLISGGERGIAFWRGQINTIYIHSHPYHLLPTGPSVFDIKALRSLGQRSSYLLERGNVQKFWSQ